MEKTLIIFNVIQDEFRSHLVADILIGDYSKFDGLEIYPPKFGFEEDEREVEFFKVFKSHEAEKNNLNKLLTQEVDYVVCVKYVV